MTRWDVPSLSELMPENPVPLESVSNSAATSEARELLARICASPRDFPEKSHAKFKRRASSRVRVVTLVPVGVFAAIAIVLFTVIFPGSPGKPVSAAAAVLARAAASAADEPTPGLPGPGQYLYSETQTLETAGSGLGSTPGNQMILDYQLTSTVQSWIAPDGTGQYLKSPISVDFLTPGGNAEWGKYSAKVLAESAIGETIDPSQVPPGSELAYPDTANLPTDPSALQQALEPLVGSDNPGAFIDLVGRYLAVGTSPALRTALYQMLEQLPGIQAVGSVTDALGRSGVAVGATSFGIQQQLIFDPSTSAVLELRQIVVTLRPQGLVPVGGVNGYVAFITSGVSDSDSSPPTAPSGTSGASGALPATGA